MFKPSTNNSIYVRRTTIYITQHEADGCRSLENTLPINRSENYKRLRDQVSNPYKTTNEIIVLHL